MVRPQRGFRLYIHSLGWPCCGVIEQQAVGCDVGGVGCDVGVLDEERSAGLRVTQWPGQEGPPQHTRPALPGVRKITKTTKNLSGQI